MSAPADAAPVADTGMHEHDCPHCPAEPGVPSLSNGCEKPHSFAPPKADDPVKAPVLMVAFTAVPGTDAGRPPAAVHALRTEPDTWASPRPHLRNARFDE